MLWRQFVSENDKTQSIIYNLANVQKSARNSLDFTVLIPLHWISLFLVVCCWKINVFCLHCNPYKQIWMRTHKYKCKKAKINVYFCRLFLFLSFLLSLLLSLFPCVKSVRVFVCFDGWTDKHRDFMTRKEIKREMRKLQRHRYCLLWLILTFLFTSERCKCQLI